MTSRRKPGRSMDPKGSKTDPEAPQQPQFGTTGGASIDSQTGSAGSESGGAQFGTADSAAAAPQTGAGATQTDAPQRGARKPADRRRRN